jgi:hypothetical protein
MVPATLRWTAAYREVDLYQAALRVYTKALFQWRKALSVSRDGKTLYDFCRHGLRNLEGIHRDLSTGRFTFRPGAARRHTFNGKVRTLYLYPWEERIVDLLLYRLLSRHLDRCLSPSSYAYRWSGYGVDLCQTRIGSVLERLPKPLFVLKRDISNFFASIDHGILRAQLAAIVAPDDYLGRLLDQRVRFAYEADGQVVAAERGVPFGTPIACLFANLYLTPLDTRMETVEGVSYFRYADDILGLAAAPETARQAADACDATLAELKLAVKPSHSLEYVLAEHPVPADPFLWVPKFKHLGLEFRANGVTGLSRDKARKIRNLFRYALRRKASRFRRMACPEKRAHLAVEIARAVLLDGASHVAIIDYYLKHVRDEAQLRLIDRWLAEEVLAVTFGSGHRKGNFRRLGFDRLRAMGLPSLVHRSRLIRHGEIQTSFFRWQECQRAKGARGVAPGSVSLFPKPRSSRHETDPVGKGDGL